MTRKKLKITLAILVTGFVGLWIAGPEPLYSGAYVQNVSATQATIAKIFKSPTRMRVSPTSRPRTRRSSFPAR